MSKEKIEMEIGFDEARNMVTAYEKWMKAVSECIARTDIKDPPADLYKTQHLAFELDKKELESVMKAERVIGIMGHDERKATLSVILVGVDADGRPDGSIKPHETWLRLKNLKDATIVNDTYLKIK